MQEHMKIQKEQLAAIDRLSAQLARQTAQGMAKEMDILSESFSNEPLDQSIENFMCTPPFSPAEEFHPAAHVFQSNSNSPLQVKMQYNLSSAKSSDQLQAPLVPNEAVGSISALHNASTSDVGLLDKENEAALENFNEVENNSSVMNTPKPSPQSMFASHVTSLLTQRKIRQVRPPPKDLSPRTADAWKAKEKRRYAKRQKAQFRELSRAAGLIQAAWSQHKPQTPQLVSDCDRCNLTAWGTDGHLQ